MKKKWLIILLLAFSSIPLFTKGYNYWKSHILKPDVTVVGFVQMADGLGRQCIELINMLYPHFDVTFKKSRWVLFDDVPEKFHELLEDLKQRPLGKVVIYEDTLVEDEEVLINLFNKSSRDEIHFAYSMFESSKIPDSFVGKLQKYFDAVIVPDPYLVPIYEKAGVKIPIFVIPLGFDFSTYLSQPLKKEAHKPFVFANFSACEDRKNQVLMVEAFAKAFGNDPNVSLKIKSRRAEIDSYHAVLEAIKRNKLENVSIDVHVADKEEYFDNFKNTDCYVSLSKGEGFSIQPREAMAMGIPCIVSDNTAQSTICNSHLVKTVDSSIEVDAFFEGIGENLGTQFNVSLDDAAEAFRELYENYNSYLENASKARNWAAQYHHTAIEKRYINLIKPLKIELGSENIITEDKIITSSPELLKKYLKLYPKLG